MPFAWIDINNDLLDWLKESGEKGAAFIEREAPLLAQEIVAWYFWSSVFELSLGLCFMLLVGIALAISLFQISKIAVEEARQAIAFPACIIAALAAAVPGIAVVDGAYCATKATVAPRLVILEHITGAVGK